MRRYVKNWGKGRSFSAQRRRLARELQLDTYSVLLEYDSEYELGPGPKSDLERIKRKLHRGDLGAYQLA